MQMTQSMAGEFTIVPRYKSPTIFCSHFIGNFFNCIDTCDEFVPFIIILWWISCFHDWYIFYRVFTGIVFSSVLFLSTSPRTIAMIRTLCVLFQQSFLTSWPKLSFLAWFLWRLWRSTNGLVVLIHNIGCCLEVLRWFPCQVVRVVVAEPLDLVGELVSFVVISVLQNFLDNEPI